MPMHQNVDGAQPRVHSTIPKLLLHAGSSHWFYTPEKHFRYLLEVSGDLVIACGKRKTNVSRGTIVIGHNMLVTNESENDSAIRGVAFTHPRKGERASLVVCDSLYADMTDRIIGMASETMASKRSAELLLAELCNRYGNGADGREGPMKKENADTIDHRLILLNRYIRKNYSQPLSLDSLATMIGCNPVYLCNVYSRVFKESPMKQLQKIRMEKAGWLLLHWRLLEYP